jgi:hypothetical protein
MFFGASKRLYNPLRPLVGPLVGLSIGPHIALPQEILCLVC